MTTTYQPDHQSDPASGAGPGSSSTHDVQALHGTSTRREAYR
jgi:hypothetical protein